jgi:hypothetical protein
MILIHFDDATRDELQSLRRQELLPRDRDRLEMRPASRYTAKA